jgi:hypothetical protein
VSLIHQTYRRHEKIHNRLASKYFTLFYIFFSTLLLIVYPSQAAWDDPATQFINYLFNSSGGGLNDGDPCLYAWVCRCLDLCQVGCGWMNYVHFDMRMFEYGCECDIVYGYVMNYIVYGYVMKYSVWICDELCCVWM